MYIIITIISILHMICCIDEEGILVIESPQQLQGRKFSIQAMIPGNNYEHNIRDAKINIILSDPFDGCCPISIIPTALQLKNYFLLSDGVNNKCTDGKRVHYAREAYARGLFIIKQKQKNQPFSYWIQYNDPSLLVFFIEIQNTFPMSNYTNSIIQASIHMFPNNNQKQVSIWISSFDFFSYQVLVAWNRTLIEIPAIANLSKWSPKFVFESCLGCQNAETICGCAGKLCSPYVQSKTERRMILRENLRQYYVFLFHPDKFMVYIQLFQINCVPKEANEIEVQVCAMQICSALSFDCYKINKEIDNILEQCTGNQLEQLFAQQVGYTQVRSYPTFIVNKNQLHIKSKGLMQKQLCYMYGLRNDKNCLQINRGSIVLETIINVIYVFFGLLVLLLIGSCLLWKFQQLTKKDINKQMQMQVATAIDQYYKLDRSSEQTMNQ